MRMPRKKNTSKHLTLPNAFELQLPRSVLLYATELAVNKQLDIQTTDALKVQLSRDESFVKFTFQGGESSLLEQLNDRWRCIIRGDVVTGQDAEVETGRRKRARQTPRRLVSSPSSSLPLRKRWQADYAAKKSRDSELLEVGVKDVVVMQSDRYLNQVEGAGTDTNGKHFAQHDVMCGIDENVFLEGTVTDVVKSEGDASDDDKLTADCKDAESSVEENCDKMPTCLTKHTRQRSNVRGTNRCNKNATSVGTTIGCPGCAKMFGNVANVASHIRHVHRLDANYSEMLKTIEELTYLSSSRSRSFVILHCAVCGRERRGIELLRHIRVWHADRADLPALISAAEAEYRRKRRETKARRERDTFGKQRVRCPHCSRIMLHRASYRKHVEFTCEHNPHRGQLHNCKHCGYSTSDAERFATHCARHGTATNYVCDLCGKAYRNRSGLVIHQRDVHELVKRVPINYHCCPVCSQKFYCKTRFDRHVAKHTDNRPVQCDLCGKQFKHTDHMKRHYNEVHLNQYRYNCDRCGHGVSKLAYLKAHKCGRTRRTRNGTNVQAAPGDTSEAKQLATDGLECNDAGKDVYKEPQCVPQLHSHAPSAFSDQLELIAKEDFCTNKLTDDSLALSHVHLNEISAGCQTNRIF